MDKNTFTRPGRRPSLLMGLALVLALASPLAGEETGHSEAPFTVQAELDWKARSLDFRVDLRLAAYGLRLPQGRAEAESRIKALLPGILKDLVLALPVDSRRDIEACIADSSIEVGELGALAEKAIADSSTFTRDFRAFGIDYSLALSEVEALLIRHRSPLGPAIPIEGRASRPYSGIVIYAKSSLPVRGERTNSKLAPCLFPRIYDDSMTLILDRNGVAPEALAAWGELGYATVLDRHALARVGDDPLRIDATGIFGNLRTDLVIPRDEALKILVLPENLALLSQGRVLIIVDAESATARLGTPASTSPAMRE